MPDFDKYIAYSAARSILAYKSQEELHSLWLDFKIKEQPNDLAYAILKNVPIKPAFFHNERTNAQAFIYKKDNILYITVRGAQNHCDIVIDSDTELQNIFPNTNTNIFIQRGLRQQFFSLESFFRKEINKYIEYIDTIHFAGHSFGGAIATIASAYYGHLFKDTHKKLIKIINHTFGSPRIGNTYFVSWCKKYIDENVRITNEYDVVPNFPFSWRYVHGSDSFTLNDTNDMKTTGELQWYWRILLQPPTIEYNEPIPYHSCILYLKRILHLTDNTMDIQSILP